MNFDERIRAEYAKHRGWKHYGPKQGAECQCYADFRPASSKLRDITEAHRDHVASALWSAGFGSPAMIKQWIAENIDEEAE